MQDRNSNFTPRADMRLRQGIQRALPSLLAYLNVLRAQFAQHDCLTAAAALTYTSLLALVPLMTVTYIGLSLVP